MSQVDALPPLRRVDALASAEDLIDGRLRPVDEILASRYPGPSSIRQPVHTVYIAGDTLSPDLPWRWGQEALEILENHFSDPQDVAEVLAVDGAVAETVLERVREKLAREPIEDLRLDFEDGYGRRGDAAEDADLAKTADLALDALRQGKLPATFGVRIKSLEEDTRRRGVRSFVRFVERIGAEPAALSRFVVTVPKVKFAAQVTAFAELCAAVEQACGLPDRSLRFELQIEAPQAVLGPDGYSPLPAMIEASAGRCTGLHYGAYDYSAACGIAAEYQSMEHPVADHAKAVMQVAAAETGVSLSDGATIVFPTGSPVSIRSALALHARLVSRSLARGYYQGWDMHPGQLVTRFAATYAFFLEGAPAAAGRLAASAAGKGAEEPSTIRALSSYLIRGIDCGALSAVEIATATGQPVADLRAAASPNSNDVPNGGHRV